ncbi:MAG: CcmD family protein [Bacillota bacterium]
MDRLVYVWAAYSVIWGLIFIYTLILGRRQRLLNEEISLLKETLKDRVVS